MNGNNADRKHRIVELAANVVIIGAMVCGGGVWLHDRALHTPALLTNSQNIDLIPQIGTHIALAGVNWSTQPLTLVIAISSECSHCVNEAGFYQTLTSSPHHTPVVVAMPQTKDLAQAFLDRYHITPTKTVTADLRSIQVNATPALLLISSEGVLKQTWVGELNNTQQQEISDILKL